MFHIVAVSTLTMEQPVSHLLVLSPDDIHHRHGNQAI